jgi:hypothetical protein
VRRRVRSGRDGAIVLRVPRRFVAAAGAADHDPIRSWTTDR